MSNSELGIAWHVLSNPFRLVQAVQSKKRSSQDEMAGAETRRKFQCLSDDWLSLGKLLLIAKKRAQSEIGSS